MGQHGVTNHVDPDQLRLFTQRVLRDLRALERMIDEGMIETETRRIGMEQELMLVDRGQRPAMTSMEILERIDDEHFTTELARFNLEANLPPLEFTGDCLRRMEQTVSELLGKLRKVAAELGTDVLLTGILPTIRQTDLDMANMAPVPRYFALNAGLRYLRGSEFDLRVSGIDEINIKHDSVMLEACNTSCQVHLQVSPEEFAQYYNIAQVAVAPILAVASNSPFLFGKRLWHETRIAVFEQSIDTRLPAHHVQERRARVSFGSRWIDRSILEIYEEDIARFRVFLGTDEDEDPFEIIDQGRVPKLRALTIHNSTVWRWNRPCYGVFDGRPHLRIENRVLPSGPTILDEIANGAFWFGLVSGLAAEHEDIRSLIKFDAARSNFAAAAHRGLDSQLVWLDGRKHPAGQLILDVLLPIARRGLQHREIDTEDIDRYLSVIESRAASGQTGADWMLRSYSEMHEQGTQFQRLRALVAAMLDREKQGNPVHEWSTAKLSEAGDWKHNFQRVGQYMTTDLFTVHEDEVIDLITNVMAWRNIRHVPVEDDDHRLVGLVSYRSLMNFLARELPHHSGHGVPVSKIMQSNPPIATPNTPTLEAIELMRKENVACLPIVQDGRLVGIVSEHDFMNIAAHLLEEDDLSDPRTCPPSGGSA